MPDRFANGDPSNDSPPEYGRPADRKTGQAYHGGDLRGVREHLGYLKDLGVTGIDAIRQDTYPYVDRPFWEKWQTAIDRQFPNLVVVGEITAPTPASLAFFEGGVRRYGVDTKLPTMLDFPLEGALRSVFAQGQPMTKLVEILAQDSLYRRPEMLVMFPGNHDQARLTTLVKGDISKLMMAQAFVLTTRRVVHLAPKEIQVYWAERAR